MKKIAWVLAAVLAIALLCSAAFAEGASLTVQGAGVVFVDADRATISLGVRETGTQLADVQSLVNEKMDSVIAALKDKGVSMEDISTNTIGIYPNYDYSTDVELIVGYTAYNSLYVTISDVENAGAYIDAAFTAGANNLDNVTFFASDTTEAGRQALTLAVENAREKAEVLAAAAGMRLGNILEIREGTADEYSMPVMYARAEDAGAGTQVIASQQRVNAAVNVTFELVAAE